MDIYSTFYYTVLAVFTDIVTCKFCPCLVTNNVLVKIILIISLVNDNVLFY
jgi:hypothetical protein